MNNKVNLDHGLFNNLDELKQFLLWCKEQKMTTIDAKNLVFVYSGIDMIDDIANNVDLLTNNQSYMDATNYNGVDLSEKPKGKHLPEDDDDLYYSANPKIK